MKHIWPIFILVSILLICTLNTSFAQPPQFKAQVDNQRMNQYMDMRLQMNMQMRMQMQFMGLDKARTTIDKFTFRINMQDSTRKEFVSAIYTDTVLKKNYLLLEDKKLNNTDSTRFIKIFPSQTLFAYGSVVYKQSLYHEDPPVEHIFGIPADSCWMFKVKTGTISAYSNICEPWYDKYSPATVIGIQLNDGPIVKYNPENLKEMISNDKEALKEFDKKKYFQAIELYNKTIKKETKK